MPFAAAIPLAISGISALAGLLGGRKKTTEQSQQQDQNTNNLTAPVYDEKTANVRDLLLNMLLSRAENTPDYTQNLVTSGIKGVNNSYDTMLAKIRNNAISSGLGRTSAGFAPQAGVDIGRAGAISDVMLKAPLQQNQIEQDRMDQLTRFFSSLPVGSSQVGHNETNIRGTGVQPGNMAGSALTSGATTGAFLYGQYLAGKK